MLPYRMGEPVRRRCKRYNETEHAHLLVCPRDEEYSISPFLESLKKSVARHAILHLRRDNPGGLKYLAMGQRNRPYRFWQAGGGHDRNLVTAKVIHWALAYIHNNPVRRNLVGNPADWPWSSAGDWMEHRQGPVTLDQHSFPMQ